LHIGKAKVVGNLSDCVTELVGELDFRIIRKLRLPVLAVGDALIEIRIGEEILAVEATRAFLVERNQYASWTEDP
jgi:hypothetical protein